MPPVILYCEEPAKLSGFMLSAMKPEVRKTVDKPCSTQVKYIDGMHRLYAAFERGDKTVPLLIPSWQDVKKVKI